MINWKKDLDGKEYTTTAGAARYLGIARTSFIYLVSDRCQLDDNKKPKASVVNCREVFYKDNLDEWKNKTSKIKFKFKKVPSNSKHKTSNVTNFPNKTNKTS
jgi:hypothetical protein